MYNDPPAVAMDGKWGMAPSFSLEPDDVPAVRQALGKKYPILQGQLVPLAHRLRHYDTAHYELSTSQAPIAPN